MKKSFYVKYIGIIDGDMGILTRKIDLSSRKQSILSKEEPSKEKLSEEYSSAHNNEKPLINPMFKKYTKSRRMRNKSTREAFHSTLTNPYKEITFKYKKPTLLNILMSPIALAKKQPEKAKSLTKFKVIKDNFPKSFLRNNKNNRNAISSFNNTMYKEKVTGIPNPEKYYSKVMNDVMPSKKFFVSCRSDECKRKKNYKSLVQLNCPPQQIGLTGSKFTKTKMKHSTTNTRIESYNSQKVTQWLNMWRMYKKVKIKNTKIDEHIEDNILNIKTYYGLINKRNRSLFTAHKSRKKHIVLNLNSGYLVFLFIILAILISVT